MAWSLTAFILLASAFALLDVGLTAGALKKGYDEAAWPFNKVGKIGQDIRVIAGSIALITLTMILLDTHVFVWGFWGGLHFAAFINNALLILERRKAALHGSA